VPLKEKNGLYFIKLELRPLPPQTQALSAARPFGAKLGELDTRRPHLWAARLHLSERALREVAKLNLGTGLPAVMPQAMLEDALADTFLRRANQKRRHVAHKARKECKCGEIWHIDFWGPAGARSPVDGTKYHLLAQCAHCDFSRCANTSRADLKAVIALGEHIIAQELKLRHQVLELRVDADPKLPLRELIKHFEPKGVTVSKVPGGFHEGVQLAEAADFMTKKTEQKKVDASVAFATNSRNVVPPTAK